MHITWWQVSGFIGSNTNLMGALSCIKRD